VKKNLQTDRKSDRMSEIQAAILAALDRNPVFKTVAAPRKIIPPRFNLYKDGMYYGDHVDNAIMGRQQRSGPGRLFPSPCYERSADYDGGGTGDQERLRPLDLQAAGGPYDLLPPPRTVFTRFAPSRAGNVWPAYRGCKAWVRDPTRREIMLDLAMVSQMIESGGPNAVRAGARYSRQGAEEFAPPMGRDMTDGA